MTASPLRPRPRLLLGLLTPLALAMGLRAGIAAPLALPLPAAPARMTALGAEAAPGGGLRQATFAVG